MSLPKTVERQLAEAEALQQALAGQQSQAPAAAVQAPAPAPEPAPQAAPAQAPAPAPSDDWQHRFKTLQGMYNAEAARFQATLKQYESQVAGLAKQVEAAAEAAKTRQADPPKGPQVDPRDASQFGEDMMEMVTRYVTRAVEQMRSDFATYAASLDERVKALEGRVTGVDEKSTQTMESMFYRSLLEAVPDWRQINVDERWLAWLGEEDEVYGMTRQQALNDAHASLNAKRVIAVFTKFKNEVMAKQPTLASQVSPPAGASAAPPPSAPAVKVFSQRQVQDFYLDQAKGRYRGREAEAARIEAEINQAAAEGRIV